MPVAPSSVTMRPVATASAVKPSTPASHSAHTGRAAPTRVRRACCTGTDRRRSIPRDGIMAPVTRRDDSLAIALDGMILRGTVGSTVHGLHLAEQDDRDEMAVAIPPPARVLGLHG